MDDDNHHIFHDHPWPKRWKISEFGMTHDSMTQMDDVNDDPQKSLGIIQWFRLLCRKTHRFSPSNLFWGGIHIHSPWYNIAITWWICSPFITQIDPCFMQLPGRSAQAGRKIRSKVLTIGTNEAIAPCHGFVVRSLWRYRGVKTRRTHIESVGVSWDIHPAIWAISSHCFWAMGSRNMSLMRWHTDW